jgi:hypothetical protein
VQSSTTTKGNDVNTDTSGILAQYLDTCKERNKWSMKLHKLRNPSPRVRRERNEFRKSLMALFGPQEGNRAWAVFIRSIRSDMLHAKNEQAYFKKKANGLNKVLRYLRKSGYKG